MGTLVPLENLPPEARASIEPGSDAFKTYATAFEVREGLPTGTLSNAKFTLKAGTDPLEAFKASAYLHKNLPADVVRTGAAAVPTAEEERTGKYRPPIDSPSYSPLDDMNFGERALAGAGMSLHNTGQGLGQLAGLVSQADVDESRRLDAPLNDTAGGLTGNMLGTVAQAALPAGVLSKGLTVAGKAGVPLASAVARGVSGPVMQSATVGGAYGAAQPVASGENRATNAALDAAAGGLGAVIPGAVRGLGAAAKASAKPQVAALADLADQAGVKLRASQVSDNWLTKAATNFFDMLPFSNAEKLASKQKEQLSQAMAQSMGYDTPDALIALRQAKDPKTGLGARFDAMNLAHDVQVEPWHVDELNQITKDFKSGNTTPADVALSKRLAVIRDNLVNHTDPNGVIDGPKYQRIRTSLGDAAASNDGTTGYRAAVDDMKKVLDKAFDSGLTPDEAAEKNLLRQQWSNMKVIDAGAPTAEGQPFDFDKISRSLNSRTAGNRYNRSRMNMGTGNQEVPNLSRMGAQFFGSEAEGQPLTKQAMLGKAVKTLSTPAAATSLYALNAHNDNDHPIFSTALSLAGLAAASHLGSRALNSNWFSRGVPAVEGAGRVMLRGAQAGTGALNSMKDSVPLPSGFEPNPDGSNVPYMEIHGTAADTE